MVDGRDVAELERYLRQAELRTRCYHVGLFLVVAMLAGVWTVIACVVAWLLVRQ